VSADKPPRPPRRYRPADVLYVEEDVELDDDDVVPEPELKNQAGPAETLARSGRMARAESESLREIERLAKVLAQMDIDVRELQETVRRQAQLVLHR
jgi:hypothetical protein